MQDGTVQPEAIAPEPDQNPDRAAVATAVADEPGADEAPTPSEGAADAAEAPMNEGAADAASSSSVNDVADDSVATAPGGAADEPEPAQSTNAAAPVDAAATSDGDGVGDTAVASIATMPLPAEIDADDTADAPSAAEEDVEPLVAPKRDLGPEPTTMEELLAEQDSDIKSFKHGDVVEGSVVRIDKDEILVDIGAKSEGVVSNRELYGRHAESQPQLAIGDTVLVYVLQPESQEGHAVLSLRRAGLERKWRAMQEQFEAGVIIEAPVIDHNKGGLIVDCGIRGFVPISQIVDFPRRPQNDQPRDAAQEIAEKLQPFVGRKLRLKILEVNRKANRLILSEKVALYEERREKRDELFSSLQVGQKVTGTVRSIAPFGVFIDLGGIDGLVHKSELSWNKVNNPEAGYKVGDEVEAEVIDINHERGRISLSIRRLQPDPWHSTVADFNVGDVIDGTVTKLVNFGAFVRVRDGLEGLIHISELSHQRVAHPGDVVHEGQTLKLKIISLDSERHRLGLSLKQAEEPPARPAPEPGAAPAPRGERRPRPERGWSASDAVQEPEGGIDNTLAAAFAQVRDQLAASEEAQSTPDDLAAAEVATSEPAASEPADSESTTGSADVATGDELETASGVEPAGDATAETEASPDVADGSGDIAEVVSDEVEAPSAPAADEAVSANADSPAVAPEAPEAAAQAVPAEEPVSETAVAQPEANETSAAEPDAASAEASAADADPASDEPAPSVANDEDQPPA